MARTTRLSDHLAVVHAHINVGVLHDGGKALLFDCGDGSAVEAVRKLGVESIEAVAFTHHHRDQACGACALAEAGAGIGVPAAERRLFDDVAAYWNDPKSRWHLYNLHPHHLTLAEPVPVNATYKGGDRFAWGPATITVLDTPGHTDGSVSYLVEVDGRRVAFCGDAIYDAGQVWDVHSLQKGTQTSDYHGFLGARPQLVESLGRIKAAKPDVLVPSHGKLMRQPAKAIDALVERLDLCYDKYVAISALRHYFPKLFADYAGRPGHMPIRKGKPKPACLRHIGTTWVVISKDKAAFVIDCGNANVIKQLRKMLAAGEIRSVEGLWVTHYHDDHVDAIPQFQKAFGPPSRGDEAPVSAGEVGCPCYADGSVAKVISEPMAWRLPCISPSQCRVDRVTKEGETWQWHEFKMTAYHLPGQTLYHGGLLVEGGDLRLFFVGDSFTMAGIDDYCSSNRNWLGRGAGFDRCIELVERLKPTHMFNCHVDVGFDFTPGQCRFMRANLAERETLYGQLVPWDHANYGMDEPWVRCHPYEQRARPGADAAIRLVVTNHSAEAHQARCRPVLPRAWTGGRGSGRAAKWADATIPAKAEGSIPCSVRVPRAAKPGRHVVPFDLIYGPWALPQFTEAILVVE